MRTNHLFIIGLAAVAGATCQAATRYASTTGSEIGNCTNWTSACTLSHAIAVAQSADEIWLKAGTYAGPLILPNGVKVIGGFAGTETLASQSNPAANATIISAPSNERAVYSIDSASSTVLRGLTLKNGSDYVDADGGGGLYAEDSSAVFVNCIFENNIAKNYGGAVLIKGTGSPNFVNCIFRNNGAGAGEDTTPLGGGAVYLQGGTSTFTNCLFHGNKAGAGGVIMAADGTATMINCTLSENDSTRGDGAAVYDEQGRIRLRNTIVWQNDVAAGYGSAQFLNDGSAYPASVRSCNVEGGFAGTGNINGDPVFVQPGAGDFTLASTSPCRDVGSNSFLPPDLGDLDWDGNTMETLPKDLAGQIRKRNFTVDMGAYEGPWTINE